MIDSWAHSCNVAGERHRLEDHLRATAELAGRFGRPIGSERLCYVAGLVHDVGKVVGPWQDYLLASEAGVTTRTVNHKSSGANLFARLAREPGRLIIEGHHSGIPNFGDHSDDAIDPERDRAVEAAASRLLPELAELLDAGSLIPDRWSQWATADTTALEMAVRLSHSALVDADFLDTAAHFNATQVQLAPAADFAALQVRFTDELSKLLATRSSSPVDGMRASLLDDCLAAASEAPGVFRLPAPTGSGKTISAAAFAIAHAANHRLSRIIVAVPFLSITEQNAAVYRRLVGEDNVVEHHSGVDPRGSDHHEGALGRRAKYGVENWDAPFVVTTTVQLFESLFSNRPARTRKLHRLANAVIILDEVQAIPPRVLPVILDGLRILQQYFGATIVLSSATQPTWDLLGPWRDAAGLNVRDIVSEPRRLYEGLRRNSVDWVRAGSLDAVADLLAAEPRAMAVVNTTANARDLARLVRERAPEGLLHLSTRMFAGHRRAVLDEVRSRLEAGLPVRLVSTQLVEAGVDLDFPVVFRAMAPAENLSQARGRCNREGRLASGRFVVLECPELVTLEAYKVGVKKTRDHFWAASVDLDDPDAMRRYYADLYATLDLEGLKEPTSIQAGRATLRFRDVAEEFRMIQDDSAGVMVAEAPGAEAVLRSLARHIEVGGAPPPDRFRQLQEFTASIPQSMLPRAAGYIFEELPGVSVWRGPYDLLTGVSIDGGARDSVW